LLFVVYTLTILYLIEKVNYKISLSEELDIKNSRGGRIKEWMPGISFSRIQPGGKINRGLSGWNTT
jgi:hypothetical protein